MDKSKKLIIVIILLIIIIGGVSFYAFHQAKENKEMKEIKLTIDGKEVKLTDEQLKMLLD